MDARATARAGRRVRRIHALAARCVSALLLLGPFAGFYRSVCAGCCASRVLLAAAVFARVFLCRAMAVPNAMSLAPPCAGLRIRQREVRIALTGQVCCRAAVTRASRFLFARSHLRCVLGLRAVGDDDAQLGAQLGPNAPPRGPIASTHTRLCPGQALSAPIRVSCLLLCLGLSS